mmetsp:Transcript_63810/g.106114  ORF Transcript_63810/g.106114 Transcript_63810/m.106114 type:complete len:227 (-) Transcript_63810:271-951(-)
MESFIHLTHSTFALRVRCCGMPGATSCRCYWPLRAASQDAEVTRRAREFCVNYTTSSVGSGILSRSILGLLRRVNVGKKRGAGCRQPQESEWRRMPNRLYGTVGLSTRSSSMSLALQTRTSPSAWPAQAGRQTQSMMRISEVWFGYRYACCSIVRGAQACCTRSLPNRRRLRCLLCNNCSRSNAAMSLASRLPTKQPAKQMTKSRAKVMGLPSSWRLLQSIAILCR